MSVQLSTNVVHVRNGGSYDEVNALKGSKGDVGATPHLTIGTVTTVAPTADASATITGTDENPVLNLSLPRGATGEVSEAQLDEVIDDLNDVKQDLTYSKTSDAWESGGLNQSGGNVSATSRIRNTEYFGKKYGQVSVHTINGYVFTVAGYTSDGTCQGLLCTDGTFKTSGGTVAVVSHFDFASYGDGSYLFKIILRNGTDYSATIDVTESVNCIYVYSVDSTLSLGGISADAKAVGDTIKKLFTDGNNIYHELPDGTKSRTIEFAEGCIVDGFIDTTPQIDMYDKGMADANVGNKVGACITALYSVNVEHTYTVYRANANNFSFSGHYSCQKFKDGVYVRYASFPSTANTAQTLTFTNDDKSEESGINQIRFTLITAEVKDSYMYDNVTGEVVFAGSNTQYYGKKYIDGHFADATIITDKNIGEMGLGLIIGKDGAAHLSIDDLAIQGDGIKFADNAVEDALYETKPRIFASNSVVTTSGTIKTREKFTVLEKYGLVDPGKPIILYQADNSSTPTSWSGANYVQWFLEDAFLGYNSISITMNTENKVAPSAYYSTATGFRLALVTDYIDDSYAYDEETGYIYFAGKNTPYYGLKSIYDSNVVTGLASVIREIDDDILHLRNDNHDMIPIFLTTDQHSSAIGNVINTFLKK